MQFDQPATRAAAGSALNAGKPVVDTDSAVPVERSPGQQAAFIIVCVILGMFAFMFLLGSIGIAVTTVSPRGDVGTGLFTRRCGRI
jgi:hypothetical protein